MNNKLTIGWTLVITLLLIFAHCSTEINTGISPNETQGGYATFSLPKELVPISPMRANQVSDDNLKVPANDREKKIHNLIALLFMPTVQEFIKAVDITLPTNSDPCKVKVESYGSYDMWLVANDGKSASYYNTELKSKKLTDFQKLISTVDPGKGEDADRFLMLSDEPKSFALTSAAPAPDLGTIHLSRASARIDIFNEIPGLKVTKISLKNRVTNTLLLTASSFASAVKADADYTIPEGKSALVAKMYSYENMTAGDTYLIVSSTYNDIVQNDLTIKLYDKTGKNLLPLKRNYLYEIKLVPRKGTDPIPGGGDDDPNKNVATFEITVLDWNEENARLGITGDVLMPVESSVAGRTDVPDWSGGGSIDIPFPAGH